MTRKLSGIYSILVGVAVLGMWSMTLLAGGIKEGPIEISFHITSEFLMAFLLVIGGAGLLRNKIYGKKVFLISNGMLIYSVLNAAGYFGQSNDFAMMCMFAAIFIISSVFLVLELIKRHDF